MTDKLLDSLTRALEAGQPVKPAHDALLGALRSGYAAKWVAYPVARDYFLQERP